MLGTLCTWLIGLGAAAAVALVLYWKWKNRGKGCCGGCSGCKQQDCPGRTGGRK